nr:crustacean hyperglycemic hormone-like [Rhipicephalus microplus]
MTASFLMVSVRWLAATMVVCSLCTASNQHKRSFLELGCRGNFEQSYLARLERVCEECYQLYQDPKAYNMCRDNCFKNEYFFQCAEALLLKDEIDSLKSKVDYLYSR